MITGSGTRIHWRDLPLPVRAGVEGILGSPVVSAVSQPGGFSPGAADRIVTASGRRAFVKAAGPQPNPLTPDLHRMEIAVSSSLPPGPVPAFLGSYDDGTWVALVLADVEGRHPATPWLPDELEQVLAMLTQIADRMTAPEQLPEAAAAFEDIFGRWQRLADDPDPALQDRAPWVAERMDWLIASDAAAFTAIAGNSLVHQDIRADNVLLTGAGAVLVDWPYASRGAPWVDSVLLTINVRLFGGHDVTGLLRRICARHEVSVATVLPVLTGALGFFADSARLPAPPGLPTVRAFQQAQADALLGWLPELVQAFHGTP